MRHEAEIQQQAIAETPCTETAPCFACLRCFVTLTNILATDPNVRAHMTGVETRPAWKPAWKHAAEAGGLLKGDGSDGAITIKAEAGAVHVDRPHVAALPTGERVELPAGTVLREATPEDAARAKLRAARRRLADAGDRRDGDACDAAERDVEQLEKVLVDLTERAGLPREMAPKITAYDPNDSSWAARYTEAMRVNEIQRAEIERLRKQLENSATPADRAVGAAMLGSLR